MGTASLTRLSVELFGRQGGFFNDDVEVDLQGRDRDSVPYPEQVELAARCVLSKIWVAPFAGFDKQDLTRISVDSGPEADVRHIVSQMAAKPA